MDQIRIYPETRLQAGTGPTVFALKEVVLQAPPLPLSENEKYGQLLTQVQEAARNKVPKGAVVLVINKGDDDLLRLPGRIGWHFPQAENGGPLGYNLDEGEAIAHLEALRRKGAQFLLIPEPYFWWLEDYGQFRRHLEQHYRLVARRENVYYLFDLRQARADAR